LADSVDDFCHSSSPRFANRFIEGWSIGDGVYFTFVTGLTIGYGDIVPRQALARALAIGIGICGFFLTGLIAGIAVHAMQTALTDRDTG
jgi:ion channel